MNIERLEREAHLAVRQLACKYGYGDHIIQVRIKKRKMQKVLTPYYVIDFICYYYGISKAKMKSKIRSKPVVKVRQIVQYFLYKYCGVYLDRVGELTNREYTTVIYSRKTIGGLMEVDRRFMEEILNLERELLKGITKYKQVIN